MNELEPPEDADLASLAAAAKALGHPVRLQLLQILLRRGACVCGALVEALPLAQSTVSQHLKVLKKAGLVIGTIDGPSVCYCADPDRLRAVAAGLNRLADSIPAPACTPPVDASTCCPPSAGENEESP